MRVSLPPYLGMSEYFIQAGQELGYPRTDLNAKFDEGMILKLVQKYCM